MLQCLPAMLQCLETASKGLFSPFQCNSIEKKQIKLASVPGFSIKTTRSASRSFGFGRFLGVEVRRYPFNSAVFFLKL